MQASISDASPVEVNRHGVDGVILHVGSSIVDEHGHLTTAPMTASAALGPSPGEVLQALDPTDDRVSEVNLIGGGKTYVFACSEPSCNKVFTSQRDLAIHYYYHKDKSDSFICNICRKVLTSEILLRKHMKAHSLKYKQKTCNICYAVFDFGKELEDHHRQYHLNEKKYKCSICGAAFSWEENLFRHIKAHVGETHRCIHCNKGFVDERRLNVHMSKEHAFGGNTNPDRPYPCPVCDKCFKFDFSYKAHLQSHSQDEIDEANLSEFNPLKMKVFDQQKKFACKACDKKFASKTIFQQHVKLHEIAEIQILCLNEQKNVPDDKEFFVRVMEDTDGVSGATMKISTECDGDSFDYEGEQNSSEKNEDQIVEVLDSHDTNLEKYFEKFENDQLSESKKTKYDFSMIDDQPYKCEHCDKSFRWEVSLVTHRREHRSVAASTTSSAMSASTSASTSTCLETLYSPVDLARVGSKRTATVRRIAVKPTIVVRHLADMTAAVASSSSSAPRVAAQILQPAPQLAPVVSAASGNVDWDLLAKIGDADLWNQEPIRLKSHVDEGRIVTMRSEDEESEELDEYSLHPSSSQIDVSEGECINLQEFTEL